MSPLPFWGWSNNPGSSYLNQRGHMLFHESATHPFAFILLALRWRASPSSFTGSSCGAGTWSPSDICAVAHLRPLPKSEQAWRPGHSLMAFNSGCTCFRIGLLMDISPS